MRRTPANRRFLIVLGTLAVLVLVFSSTEPASAGPPLPSNDDFAGAIVIGSLPYTNTESTQGATEELGEPLTSSCSSETMATTVWYTFTPSTDLLMQADTFGTDFPHVGVIYSGNDLASLTPVGCLGLAFGAPLFNHGFDIFIASAGVTYYFQIGSCTDPACGTGGILTFNLQGGEIPEMVLNIKGGDCDDAAQPTKCDVLVGSSFTLSVDVGPIPVQGYSLLQTFIDFGEYFPDRTEDPDAVDDPLTPDFVEGPGPCDDGIDNGGDIIFDGSTVVVINHDRFDSDCVDSGLEYKPTVAASDEFTWQDCDPTITVRSQFGPALVGHGCLTGLTPPLLLSAYTGNAVDLDFTCSTEVTTTEVRLVPALTEGSDPVALTSGAQFSRQNVFGNDIQVIPEVSNLTVNCVAPVGVGGIALDSDLRSLPLETADLGSTPWGMTFAIAAIAGLVAMGGAAWYAKRRSVGRR